MHLSCIFHILHYPQEGIPPQLSEILPAKIIDALLFAKSVQVIFLSFSSESLIYWTTLTPFFWNLIHFSQKQIACSCLYSFSGSFFPSSIPQSVNVLEFRSPLSSLLLPSRGHPLYSPRSYSRLTSLHN